MIKEIRRKLKLKGKFWIGFVGDSLTSCEWVHPNWREIVEYVIKEELQKEMSDWHVPSWGIRCFNFGFDGSTTKDIVKSVNLQSAIYNELDLVLGLMGGNDPLFGIKPQDTENNVEKIINKFKSKGAEVVWATSLPDLRGKKNDVYEPYRLATLKIANTVDIFKWYQQWDMEKFFTFKSEENVDEGIKAGEVDPIHPNQLGNAYIAKFFLEKGFGIKFDPEKFWVETQKGEKYPGY